MAFCLFQDFFVVKDWSVRVYYSSQFKFYHPFILYQIYNDKMNNENLFLSFKTRVHYLVYPHCLYDHFIGQGR